MDTITIPWMPVEYIAIIVCIFAIGFCLGLLAMYQYWNYYHS